MSLTALLIHQGLPKAAVVTQQRLWAASFLQTVGGVTAEDVLYITLPLYHTSGFVVGFTGAIESGKITLHYITVI